jgi:rhodanese-related sulfurtransferase
VNSRAFKDRLYAEFAVMAGALANPHRLELLDLLAQGERSVENLAREASLSVTNASAHLQVLRRAKLVEADKRGLYMIYRLSDEQVFALWRTLRDCGSAHLAEVQRLVTTYFTERDALEAIDKQELLRRLHEESVVILDVRPELEYHQGHIPAALSMPLSALEQRLHELPRDREVVAYCRGPYCVFADHAVQVLRNHGFQARRLSEGFPEWRAAGYPSMTEQPQT